MTSMCCAHILSQHFNFCAFILFYSHLINCLISLFIVNEMLHLLHVNRLFLTACCPSFVDSVANATLQTYFILCRISIKFHYNWWPDRRHIHTHSIERKKKQPNNFNAIADSYDWMWKKNHAVASKMMRLFFTVSYTCQRQQQRLAKQREKTCVHFVVFFFCVSLFNLCSNGSCSARMSVFVRRQWCSHLLINILQWFE